MKLKVICLLLFSLLLITGCKDNKFYLEEKYYNNSEFIELSIDNYNELVEDKETFGIYIYQPMCVTSNEFGEVLKEYSENYQLTFYKMPFSLTKETNLKDYIKYYPSFVIIHNGEILDYLDANSDDDTLVYKSVDGFKEWFESYVLIK